MPRLIFDFADYGGRPRRLCFVDPLEVVVAPTLAAVRPALHRIQQLVAQGYYAAGYLSYEAAPAFEPAMAVRQDAQLPLLWFAIFDTPRPLAPSSEQPFRLSDWQPASSRARYDADIAAVRQAIGRGDTYQANYTLRLRARFQGDSRAFYEQLRAAQRADYCAYLDTGRWQILSASPELFLRWRDGQVITRPMKGTVRRGRWPAEDAERAAWLAASEKNRAENLMIVDLLRNDLGRIAEIGTVQVPALFVTERYPTVFQLTSTVSAQTRPGTTLDDLLAALFPCGSITGAPKIETMRLIARLEQSPREVYCGAIGLISAEETVFNVAIRTVIVDGEQGTAEYGVGGGITWDSTAADEYAEALAKAALLTERWPAFELLETMRLEAGAYWLRERHLQRLAESARYFGLPLDLEAVAAALDAHAHEYPTETRRVRLLVGQDGSITIGSTPFADAIQHGPAGAHYGASPPQPPILPDTYAPGIVEAPELASDTAAPDSRAPKLLAPNASTRRPQLIALARSPVSRKERFLFHKTTNRASYETRRAEHPQAFDVLLWNEQDELTEFTIGNLVAEIDGELLTPPRDSGLLAGVLRAELLAQGVIRERVLTKADLAHTTRLWLINSLRGWISVTLNDE